MRSLGVMVLLFVTAQALVQCRDPEDSVVVYANGEVSDAPFVFHHHTQLAACSWDPPSQCFYGECDPNECWEKLPRQLMSRNASDPHASHRYDLYTPAPPLTPCFGETGEYGCFQGACMPRSDVLLLASREQLSLITVGWQYAERMAYTFRYCSEFNNDDDDDINMWYAPGSRFHNCFAKSFSCDDTPACREWFESHVTPQDLRPFHLQKEIEWAARECATLSIPKSYSGVLVLDIQPDGIVCSHGAGECFGGKCWKSTFPPYEQRPLHARVFAM